MNGAPNEYHPPTCTCDRCDAARLSVDELRRRIALHATIATLKGIAEDGPRSAGLISLYRQELVRRSI